MTHAARILVVEDDATARLLLSDMLRYAGYHVTQAPDGETALELLEHEPFDVVLTDIVMRDISGVDVLHTARRRPTPPAVILLTGHATVETSVAALRAGAFDYLLKPCPDEKLRACIARAVQHHHDEQQLAQVADLLAARYRPDPAAEHPASPAPRSERAAEPLRVGALVVGNSRKDVTLHDEPVRVTPIEHALLRCLAATPGAARSYGEMVRHTHGAEMSESEAQTLLRAHIHNLRKKLPAGSLINDRGSGYMLIDPDAAAS
jgi:DNA-binding response OmpR family regulator